MITARKALIGTTGALLFGFVVFGIYTWARVLRVIPYSSSCVTTLVEISRRTAVMLPFFACALLAAAAAFECCRQQLPTSWRFTYVALLGFGVALFVIPWLVSLPSS